VLLGRHPLRHRARVDAELAQERHVVPHQPLPVDAVLQDHAVGDRAGHEAAAGRRAVGAGLGVPPAAGHQVGGVEAGLVVAAPDHLGGHAAAVGELDDALDRGTDHVLAAVAHAQRAVDHGVGGVVRVDEARVALVPDPVRAAHDVVNDVGVAVVEAAQALRPRPVGRHQGGEVAPLDLQDVAGGVARPRRIVVVAGPLRGPGRPGGCVRLGHGAFPVLARHGAASQSRIASVT
jgi:hypothetical protein